MSQAHQFADTEPERRHNSMVFPTPLANSREVLERECTNVLAAAVIADPGFPNYENLPAIAPPPFCHFGHLSLIDYEKLVALVWGTAMPIVKQLRTYWWMRRLVSIPVALVVGAVAIAINSGERDASGAGLVVFVLAYMLCNYFLGRALKKNISETRHQAIVNLLNGEVRESSPTAEPVRKRLSKLSALSGNGALGTGRTPMVVCFNDAHPFPGFGRLQYDKTFVCVPAKNINQVLADGKLEACVVDAIEAACRGLAIRDTSVGQIVSLGARSLNVDSAWLDADGRLPVWIPDSDLYRVQSVDDSTSVRIYQSIQFLFPAHESMATLFFRVFPAGNAAACHIALATMGPLASGRKYCLDRLQKYNSELRYRWWKNFFRRKPKAQDETWLEYLKDIFSRKAAFQNSLASIVRGAKPLFKVEKTLKEAQGQALQEVMNETVLWPGNYLQRPNYRENNSLTMTPDFFGKSEVISTVTACYEQTVTSMLDAMKELGFDVSKYQDENGKYIVNAQRIDQLVVGERVIMSSDKKASEATPAKALA